MMRVEAYWNESVVNQVQEFGSAYPDRFKPLRTLGQWGQALNPRTNPMLWVIKTIDQTEYIKRGYELGLMPCGSNPNYELTTGAMIFSPDLHYIIINDGARRQGGKIRFTHTLKADAIDCWTLGKRKIGKEVVVVSQLRPAIATPPTERADAECPICKSEMTGATRFTCPNGHQTHLQCWNDWTANLTRNMKCCVCRCDVNRSSTQTGKEYLRTEFHLLSHDHKTADLLALSIIKKTCEARGRLLGLAIGDTLFRLNSQHHLTEWRPADDERTARGVMITPNLTYGYWRDFLTFYRSAENIDYLYNVKAGMYDYSEAEFLADLNRTTPVGEAMRLLTEAPDGERHSKLKWRIYLETKILTKTDEEVMTALRTIIQEGEHYLSQYDGVSRRNEDLPAPAVVEIATAVSTDAPVEVAT